MACPKLVYGISNPTDVPSLLQLATRIAVTRPRTRKDALGHYHEMLQPFGRSTARGIPVRGFDTFRKSRHVAETSV
jgi:hypothetical protein